jgi:hypothetical protein
MGWRVNPDSDGTAGPGEPRSRDEGGGGELGDAPSVVRQLGGDEFHGEGSDGFVVLAHAGGGSGEVGEEKVGEGHVAGNLQLQGREDGGDEVRVA